MTTPPPSTLPSRAPATSPAAHPGTPRFPLRDVPGAPGASPASRGAGGTLPAAAGSRMSEAQLEGHVRKILKDVAALSPAGDVLGYHTYFSKASHAGFPDWVFAGPGGVLFRELKTARGRLSLAQVMWRRVLRQAGADVDVWHPADLASGRVAQELAAIAGLRVTGAGEAGE